MEFEPKILRIVIGRGKEKKEILLDKPSCSVTYGYSSKCDIVISGASVPKCENLIEKKNGNICLYTNKFLSGRLIVIDSYYDIESLKNTKLLVDKKGKKCLPLLRDYGGDLKVGDVDLGFIFEIPVYKPFDKIPKPKRGVFSVSRLKAIGSTYFKILLGSFIFHFTLIMLIILVPPPIIKKKLGPLYRKAKVDLGLLKKIEKPKTDVALKTEAPVERSLMASIGSKKRLKGFVRNLFHSKTDSFDVSQISTSTPQNEGSGGLFKRIETKKSVIKREELKDVGPLFASVKGTKGISRGNAMEFVESELITESPEIEGTLNRDAISEIVRTGEGALRFCYEEALIRRPKIQGRIVVLFKVTPEGKIEKAKVESSTLNDGPFERCIIKKVSAWRFPKPEEGKATIRYPFVFYTSRSG